MSSRQTLTRRQALLGAGAAGFAAAAGLGLRPGVAQASAPDLLIPKLIEARNDTPVTLTLQRGTHRFGGGRAAASSGISSNYLGPVVRVRTGDTFAFNVENRLNEATTLHWHGLLIPSEVDGGPHNTIAPGGVWTPELPIAQPTATTWFHPHPHGRTARQVYDGLAGMMIIADGGDRDRGLPADYGVDDIPLMLQDKRFDRNGAPVYDPNMMDLMQGFAGDTMVVNGAIDPVAKVPAGFVRLRLLNAANARNFDLRFADGRPFFVIAGDSSLLPEPVERTSLVIAPGERYEVLVDFADGRGVDLVTGPDPEAGRGMMGMMGMMRSRRRDSRPQRLVRFAPDNALKPAVQRLPQRLVSLPAPDIRAAVAWRTFTLDEMLGMGGMGMRARMSGHRMGMMGINGRPFAMDRVDVTVKHGTTEIWEIVANEMAHPFHIHGVNFHVLGNEGRKPSAEQAGLKDVVLVRDRAEILVRFDRVAGPAMPFMYHCHILEHEDNGMMGQFAVA